MTKAQDAEFGNNLRKRLEEEFPDYGIQIELNVPRYFGHLVSLMNKNTHSKAQLVLSYQEMANFLPEAEFIYLPVIVNRFRQALNKPTPA